MDLVAGHLRRACSFEYQPAMTRTLRSLTRPWNGVDGWGKAEVRVAPGTRGPQPSKPVPSATADLVQDCAADTRLRLGGSMPTQKRAIALLKTRWYPCPPTARVGVWRTLGREGFRTSPEGYMYLDSYVPIMLRLLRGCRTTSAQRSEPENHAGCSEQGPRYCQ